MIDLWMSRRDKFIQCKWFSQNETEPYVGNDQIEYFQHPSGMFYAKEMNSYSLENQALGDAFLVDANNITLETSDNVKDIELNDLVEYEGFIWRVNSKTTRPVNKQRQFRRLRSISEITYLALRR